MSVKREEFGAFADGRIMHKYTMTNSQGMKAVISDYGADLLELWVPDKNGELKDVVLGFADAATYEENPPAFGAVIGRYANRIAGAAFTLNGKEYKLAKNDGGNNLHSKPGSYFQRFWDVEETGENENGSFIVLSLLSPDGDQNYPGNLQVTVTYTLTDDNSLVLNYQLLSDADTIASMTNHSYFNLNGHDSGDVLGQYVTINADEFTVPDAALIPTGEIRSVKGTPLDFTTRKQIGKDIYNSDPMIQNDNGYDHNYVLNGEGMRAVAQMDSEETGIVMDVHTDMPGMQLYTANSTEMDGKNGAHYKPYCAACFETQFYPDSIHHDNFPSCVLKAGEEFESTTVFQFSVKE